jgi:hypothetical protein
VLGRVPLGGHHGVFMCVCVCVCVRACVYVCVGACPPRRSSWCVHVCVCVCIFVYVCGLSTLITDTRCCHGSTFTMIKVPAWQECGSVCVWWVWLPYIHCAGVALPTTALQFHRQHLPMRVASQSLPLNHSCLGLARTIYIYIIYIVIRQENLQIYSHIRCAYTVLANPIHVPAFVHPRHCFNLDAILLLLHINKSYAATALALFKTSGFSL